MKAFFGIYLLLLIGVFMLWSIEPLHRAQEASSIAVQMPPASLTGVASASTASSGAAGTIAAAPKKILVPPKIDERNSSPTTTPSASLPPPAEASSSESAASPAETALATTTPAAGGREAAPTSAEQALAAQIEAGIHIKINEARAGAGLSPLSTSNTLTSVARTHSVDMLVSNYFTHNDAAGCSSSCRITAAGYPWSTAGENIYMMSGYSITIDKAVDMVVSGWMDSAGHRANILNPAFTQEGIGIAFDGTRLYATEDFATPR